MTDADLSQVLSERIQAARRDSTALSICCGNSKQQMLGRNCTGKVSGEVLDVSGHRGIIDYQPRELVLTARAGTPVQLLQETLAAQGQYLSFEPPEFHGVATLGGTLACNLSGPGRPWSGSVRDMVLGVQLISGTGEILNFGGQVMKNVAGYDISRLQAGALGTLGVISTISLKVLPLPETTLTLCYETSAADAVEIMNKRAATPKPLTGACWVDGRLYLRLAGAASATAQTAEQWGGERLTNHESASFWGDLREMALPFFAGDFPLWRMSLRSNTPLNNSQDKVLLDWGGAQRWLRGTASLETLSAEAVTGKGHAQLFQHGDREGEVRSQPGAVQKTLQLRLKHTFDPDGILNPGRLYSWM